jgi:putative DNA primase/helicase
LDQTLTAEERATLARRNEEAHRKREEADRQKHEAAATEAKRIYDKSALCTWHSYLTDKRVKPASSLRVHSDGRLIVPIFDENQKLSSLQFVDSEGEKRYLPGGKKGDCFSPIGFSDDGAGENPVARRSPNTA